MSNLLTSADAVKKMRVYIFEGLQLKVRQLLRDQKSAS